LLIIWRKIPKNPNNDKLPNKINVFLITNFLLQKLKKNLQRFTQINANEFQRTYSENGKIAFLAVEFFAGADLFSAKIAVAKTKTIDTLINNFFNINSY